MIVVDLLIGAAVLLIAAALWLYLYREETLAAWWCRIWDTEGRGGSAPEAPDPVAADFEQTGIALADEVEDGTGEAAVLRLRVAHLRVDRMDDTAIAAELGAMVHAGLADLWAAPARLGEYYQEGPP